MNSLQERGWSRPRSPRGIAVDSIRPLPKHRLQGGGNILRPGWTGCLTLGNPVPPQSGHSISVLTSLRLGLFIKFISGNEETYFTPTPSHYFRRHPLDLRHVVVKNGLLAAIIPFDGDASPICFSDGALIVFAAFQQTRSPTFSPRDWSPVIRVADYCVSQSRGRQCCCQRCQSIGVNRNRRRPISSASLSAYCLTDSPINR